MCSEFDNMFSSFFLFFNRQWKQQKKCSPLLLVILRERHEPGIWQTNEKTGAKKKQSEYRHGLFVERGTDSFLCLWIPEKKKEGTEKFTETELCKTPTYSPGEEEEEESRPSPAPSPYASLGITKRIENAVDAMSRVGHYELSRQTKV